MYHMELFLLVIFQVLYKASWAVFQYVSCHILHVIFVVVIKLFWFTRRPWGRCFLVWYVLHQCFGDQCSEVRDNERECDEYGGGACGWKGDWYCREGPTNQVVKESTHVHTHTFTHSYAHADNGVQMALWYTWSFTYEGVGNILYQIFPPSTTMVLHVFW